MRHADTGRIAAGLAPRSIGRARARSARACSPRVSALGAAIVAFATLGPTVEAAQLKVFILAGQSNMEGHATIRTFDYIGDDPTTAPLLARMRDSEGKPRVCEHAYISYLTGGETNGEASGRLTAGYGARHDPGVSDGKIGPEFTFGITMDDSLDEPVLIIKAAWGGKSLFYDFRPPSAGVYPRTARDIKDDRYHESQSGQYYRFMIEHVRTVLSDPKRVCPEYDAADGFEIAGFVWLQGWNDMVDHDAYPNVPEGSAKPRFAKYSEHLAALIRDVRKDLDAPSMPFVIGVMGVDGTKPNDDVAAFRKAMTEPALRPEFAGTVTAVATAPFWSMELGAIQDKYEQVRQMEYFLESKHKDHANAAGTMTDDERRAYLRDFETKLISPAEVALWKRGASNAGYHYLGCAKTFAMMGRAFADATLVMMKERDKQENGGKSEGKSAGPGTPSPK